MVARRAHNPKVVGSNPAPATNATLAQLVERNLAKVEVTSSNLVCRSKFVVVTILNGEASDTRSVIRAQPYQVEITPFHYE